MTSVCVNKAPNHPGFGVSGRPVSVAEIAFLVLSIAMGTPALAQPPARNISIIVPAAPGGSTDVIARLVGEHMSRTVGTSVIIENVPGAGGTIASDRVASSPPDGTTILIGQLGLLAAPSLIPNIKFDPRKALQPFGLINTGPTVLVARKNLAPESHTELLTWLRANGETLNFGHGGLGTSGHLCTLLLIKALGVRANLVAYRGGAPAMNDVIGGSIDLLCDQSTNAVPQIQAATVRGVLVAASQRLTLVPDIPTAAEVGLPEVSLAVWHGLYVPRDTPRQVISRLNMALRKAVGDQAIVERFRELGTSPYPEDQQTPEAHQALFEREYDRITMLLAGSSMPGK